MTRSSPTGTVKQVRQATARFVHGRERVLDEVAFTVRGLPIGTKR